VTQNSTRPGSHGIFYGWWNVAASFVGLSLSYAMFTVFSFGVFVTPLEAEFGWSRAEISVALTITNITIVICSPLVGSLVDRAGVRRVLIPSIVLMGLAVSSMYLMQDHILHFYAMYLLIPLLGAGTLPLSYSRVVVAWFARRRGLALGISLAGFGVGAALIPPLGQWLIANFGWREAYLAFGAAIFLINLPLTVLLMRESPSKMGLQPDGKAPRAKDTVALDPHAGLTGREAARTFSFWYVFSSFLLVGFGVTSILAHLVPMLIGRGIDPTTASLYMGSLGAGLVIGRILAGHLMDRYFAPYVTGLFLTLMLLGIMVLATNVSGLVLLLAVVSIGLALGSEISEIAYIVSRYFGPRAFGQIYGTMFAAFQLGSAFGAPAFGLYYDHAGNYIGALWGIAGVIFVGIVLILRLGPYPDLATEKPA
jgi:MFS family permease